jgi:hypothetical protein
MAINKRGLGKGVKELFRKPESEKKRIAEPGEPTAIAEPMNGIDAYEDRAAVCLHRLTRRTFSETVAGIGPAIAAVDELRSVLLAAARANIEEQARLNAQARESALAVIEAAAGKGATK